MAATTGNTQQDAAPPAPPILSARRIRVDYRPGGATRPARTHRLGRRSRHGTPAPPAVNDVDLNVAAGRCLGLVGESGSGKTTLGSCLAGLLAPSSGSILYQGEPVNRANKPARLPRVHGVQVVFQDPASSLNPRRTIRSLLAEVLRVHQLRPAAQIVGRCEELLERVGLPTSTLDRRPTALSGGQRQRVAIARALAFEPTVLIADEVVSALDASVQAQVLNLLADLRDDLGVTIVLITHDLAVVNQLCDDVAVMQRGVIVEVGRRDDILRTPQHAYTQALLRAVPRLDGGAVQPAGGQP